jgi:signal transduction histidine kinase
MKSSFFKSFLITAMLLVISFIILGSAFAVFAYRFSINEQEKTLKANAAAISEMASSSVYSGSILVDRWISLSVPMSGVLSGNYVIVTNTMGNILITSDGRIPPKVGGEILNKTLMGGGYSGFGTLGGVFSKNYFSVGVPVTASNGNIVGAVFVSTSVDDLRQVILNFIRIFVSTAAAVLLLSLAWAYIAAQRMTRPLILMSSAAREFARGNFSVRVPEEGRRDEMGRLAESFNNMAGELARTEERRREFIANISHELKTPMTTIGGYVDGMIDGVIPEEKRDSYLQIVSSEVKRLSRLVTQMLEISRLESEEEIELNKQRFDLCERTRLVILGLEKKINDRRLDIDCDFDEAIDVIAEPDSITRVIYNLLDNAIKYSNEGTTIKISIQKRDKKVHFSVADTGKPIAPEERERIFDRFHKTDRSRKSEGLGLGLYLVKNIMRKHGEDVTCDCDGSTTTMRFTLPAAGS